MKKIVLLFCSIALLASCVREKMPTPMAERTVKLTFTAEYPKVSADSKIAISSDTLAWEGNEVATLIFGKSGAHNSTNPTIPSIAPGVFSGEFTIPTGFELTDLKGVVIPSGNAADYRHATNQQRIRMFVGAEQVCDGGPDKDEVPFFTELSSAQLVEIDGGYTIPEGITVKSASDLLKFYIYGKHADMQSDEVLKSVRFENGNNQYITHTIEYNVLTGSWAINKGRGGYHVNVAMSGDITVGDRTRQDAIVGWASVVFYGNRTIKKVIVTTDKAVYTKDVNQTFPKTILTELIVYQAGINLSNGYGRESLITYSADGGQTWLKNIPETFSTLAVKTGSGVSLSLETLTNIREAMSRQSVPVDLDLSASTYASATFPAVFNGTESSKSTMIRSIKFPSNVTTVGDRAFEYCSSLESVELLGIKTIGSMSFHWTGLKTLNVPHSVTSFSGYLAFGCCPQLTSVYYDSPALQSGTINHAQFAWATMDKPTALPNAYDQTAYPELYPAEGGCVFTFGPNVKHVARNMFKYNKGISEVVFNCGPVIYVAGFFEMNNVHTFDFSLVTSLASGSATSTNYIKNIGNLAKAAGKQLRILVPKGYADMYRNAATIKTMVSSLGWTIVEQDYVQTETLTGVRIGTYNVRYANGDTNSSTNKWSVRKDRLVQSIRDIDFDIFGVQEAMDVQIADLEVMVGDTYGTAYFRPNTGASSDSSVGIFYRKSEWTLSSVNNFWISPTPDEMGKYDVGKDGSYYRGAICGVLVHKKTNARIFFMDSHGCLDATSNATYAHVYVDKEQALNTERLPSFFVGDLNTTETTESSILFREHWNDTYMTIDESLREGNVGTYNAFKTMEEGTHRIDYVYYKGAGVTPTYYKCDITLYDGLYPSDHWPVYADFTIAPAQ